MRRIFLFKGTNRVVPKRKIFVKGTAVNSNYPRLRPNYVVSSLAIHPQKSRLIPFNPLLSEVCGFAFSYLFSKFLCSIFICSADLQQERKEVSISPLPYCKRVRTGIRANV